MSTFTVETDPGSTPYECVLEAVRLTHLLRSHIHFKFNCYKVTVYYNERNFNVVGMLWNTETQGLENFEYWAENGKP